MGLWGRVVAGLLAMAALALVPPRPAAAGTELRLLNWPEYTAPALLERFERETGIRVTVETYSSVQALDRLLRENPGRYDLVVATEYAIPDLIARGALAAVPVRDMPGFANVDDPWRAPAYDPEACYSVPWHWGTTSFVVDGAVFDGDIDTLGLLFDPPEALRGPVGMLYDPGEIFTMASRYLGLPRCSGDAGHLAQVEALLARRAGDHVVLTGDDLPTLRNTKRLAMAMAWNGHAMRVRGARPTVRYAYPREGVTVWTDALVTPKGAPNPAAAQRFMAFVLRPENAALQTTHTRYATAIRGADDHLDPALLQAPEIVVPPSARLEFVKPCKAALYDRYRAIWSRVTGMTGTPRTP